MLFSYIVKQLNQLKDDGNSDVKEIITTLEGSENKHEITNYDDVKEGKEGNYSGATDEGSKTYFAISNYNIEGKKRHPRVGLIHELSHAFYIDQGHDPKD
jgi:hypothetical protein